MAERSFKDHAVIITGASSGIGEALAYLLSDQGAWLALAARSVDKLNAVAAECERRGPSGHPEGSLSGSPKGGTKAIAVPTDVSDEAQCKRLIERTVEQYGRIDMLINNAGFSVTALFEDLPDLAGFREVMDTNLMGGIYCTYYALPHLKQSRGRIVGVSSVSGKLPLPFNSAYSASKHAMAGFFDTLRVELADSGVTVTMAYPDFVVTGFVANSRNASGRRRGENAAKRFYTDKMMKADTCARLILEAAAQRKRELITSTRGKLAGWGKLVSPRLMDSLMKKAVTRRRRPTPP